MKIIEYKEKYLEDVKNLLVELEEYIVTIDDILLIFTFLNMYSIIADAASFA